MPQMVVPARAALHAASLCALLLAASFPAGSHGAVKNSTLYRVTPLNYSGSLVNMDTGDIPGDCYFGLYELTFPFWCDENPAITGCMNQPILSIPGYNVYEGHIVEHDTRFGLYNPCNPNPNTGVFECTSTLGEDLPFVGKQCWYDVPEWVDDFASLCDRSECGCDAVGKLSVGMRVANGGATAQLTPVDGNPKCFNFAALNKTTIAEPYVQHDDISDADCCDLLTAVTKSESFQGFAYASYSTTTRTCKVSNATKLAPGLPEETAFIGTSGGLNGSAHYYVASSISLAERLSGLWYSTREEGQCEPGQAVGDGCWWRDHGVTRRVNATCLSNNMVLAVYADHPACWDEQCAGGVASPRVGGVLQPAFDITSQCSINCLLDTALGRNGTRPVGPGLDTASICKGFYTSFEHTDPAMFGCPDV